MFLIMLILQVIIMMTNDNIDLSDHNDEIIINNNDNNHVSNYNNDMTSNNNDNS